MPEPSPERIEILEYKMPALESLPARVTALEGQMGALRHEMRVEFSATREDLRAEIRAGDDGTRRELRAEMQVLHQEVLARIQAVDARVTEGDDETRRQMHALHQEALVACPMFYTSETERLQHG